MKMRRKKNILLGRKKKKRKRSGGSMNCAWALAISMGTQMFLVQTTQQALAACVLLNLKGITGKAAARQAAWILKSPTTTKAAITTITRTAAAVVVVVVMLVVVVVVVAVVLMVLAKILMVLVRRKMMVVETSTRVIATAVADGKAVLVSESAEKAATSSPFSIFTLTGARLVKKPSLSGSSWRG
jgi:hypothetical protein